MLDIQSEASKQSPRVASWIYEVINVLLDDLPVELSFLETGNATWRFSSRELEYVRPIRRYLTSEGRHICRDFTRAIADAGDRFDAHDRLLERLTTAAGEAHDAVMAHSAFIDSVRDALARYRTEPVILSSGVATQPSPAGAFGDDELPRLVAERVVNHIREVPQHYTDAAFWARNRERFIAYATGDAFAHLRRCVDETVAYDRELLSWLENTRYELCERFDIPAARVAVAY